MNDSSLPGLEALKGQWHQYVGVAKIAWGAITEDELLNIEGHAEQLAGLIHERYAVSREEADRQVKRFFTLNQF